MNQHGFTFIELMIVVSIAAIVAGFALPNMDYAFKTGQVKTAASDAHISLLLARSEAIKRNSDVLVNPGSTDWSNGWNVTSGGTNLKVQDPFSPDITVECETTGDNTADTCPTNITFNRTGRPENYVELRIYSAGNSKVIMRCVTMNLSGRPAVESDSDSDKANGC